MEVRYGYIPTYEALDFVVPPDAEEVVIYCDVKNGLYSMYYEESILAALKQLRETGSIDCGIISGLLNVVSFHKRWNKTRRNGKHVVKIVFFFESGRSQYHYNLNKEYKGNRLITDYSGKVVTAADMEDFGKLVRSNLEIFDKIANAIPEVYCAYLKFADADFVPHYIANTMGLANNPKSFHIIYSTDKDMSQSLRPNVVQYLRKIVKVDKFENGELVKKAGTIDHIYLNDSNCNSYFWKLTGNNNFDVQTATMYLSLLGDGADGIRGADGIGGVVAEKVFTLLWEHGFKQLKTPELFYTALDSVVSKMTEIENQIKLIESGLEVKLNEMVQNEKTPIQIAAVKKEEKQKIKDLKALDLKIWPGKSGIINKLKSIQESRNAVTLAWKQIDFDEIIRHMDVSHKERIHKVINKQYVEEITNLKDLNMLITRTLSVNIYDK